MYKKSKRVVKGAYSLTRNKTLSKVPPFSLRGVLMRGHTFHDLSTQIARHRWLQAFLQISYCWKTSRFWNLDVNSPNNTTFKVRIIWTCFINKYSVRASTWQSRWKDPFVYRFGRKRIDQISGYFANISSAGENIAGKIFIFGPRMHHNMRLTKSMRPLERGKLSPSTFFDSIK